MKYYNKAVNVKIRIFNKTVLEISQKGMRLME